MLLAERIRSAVSQIPFRYKELSLTITLSQGVTTWTDPYPFPLDRLIQVADGALYLVKHAGRNGVEFAAFEMEKAAAVELSHDPSLMQSP